MRQRAIVAGVGMTPFRKFIGRSPASALPSRAAPLDRAMQFIFTPSATGPAKAACLSYVRFAGAAVMAEAFGTKRSDRVCSGRSLARANARFVALASGPALSMPPVISRPLTKPSLWHLLTHYRSIVFNLSGRTASVILAEPPSASEQRRDVIGAPDFIRLVHANSKAASEKPLERQLVEMINRGDCTIHNENGRTLVSAFEGKDDHA